ncbi:hypothetical protein HMPREF3198_00678 [Winkia neuii]|nr:hypothetical protein HMPREF3198_00678 [Winkia neuii]
MGVRVRVEAELTIPVSRNGLPILTHDNEHASRAAPVTATIIDGKYRIDVRGTANQIEIAEIAKSAAPNPEIVLRDPVPTLTAVLWRLLLRDL